MVAQGGSSLSFSSVDTVAARTGQSASYQLDDAVGGWTVTGTSAGQWIKPDRSGSIYDPVALNAEVGLIDIPEEQTTPASAHLVCDDDSRLPPPTPPTFTVLSGPLVTETLSVLRAEPVYRNSNVLIQVEAGIWLTLLNMRVLDTDPDNFSLYGGDSVADAWQVDFFATGNPDGVADQDPDGDGDDNLFEFTAGTDPTSSSDRFEIALQRGSEAEILFGPVHTGRTYRVESTESLDTADWTAVTGLTALAAAPSAALPDPRPDEPARHYRVWIDYPWRAGP